MTRRSWALAGLVALAAMLLALAVKSWCGVPGSGADLYLRWCYSDIPPLYGVERLDQGAVPYLDHPVEYPVLTGLWMWLAALPATGAASFLVWTWLILAASAVATAVLLAREVGWPRVLAFAAAPVLIVSGAVNWDLPAVALATAGLVAHRRGADRWSGVWLGLGAAAKLFPAVLLPAVVLGAGRLRGWRQGAATAATAALAWTAVNLPVALAAPDSWLRFFRLSRERPSDWDALTTVAGHLWGWWPGTPTVNLVTGGAFLAGAAMILVVAGRVDAPRATWLAASPLLAWFLVTSKVYSPQFSLWMLPLLVLAWPGWWPWAAVMVADVTVTLTRFPYLANFVGDGVPGAWPYAPFGIAVVVRDVVLVAVAVYGWRRAVRADEQGGGPGAPAPAVAP